jgi:DNA-binding SARP family transcriptional activator
MIQRDSNATIQFQVLGPLELTSADGQPLEIHGHKLRSLLCALLMSPGHAVSLDRIISFLWGDEPPAAATGTLQAYISQLRKLLEPERGPRQPPTMLVTRPPGYALMVAPGALDSDDLEHLVTRGEHAMADGRYTQAEDDFNAALRLQRGRPFAEVADEPFAIGAVARLEQLLLVAAERRVDALLALGRVGAAAADLERLVGDHPLRERFWAQLVEALYRGDRQADALRAYQHCRTVLIEELGVEPGPALQQLEQAILAQAPLPAAPTVSLAPAAPEPIVAPVRQPDRRTMRLVGRRAELDTIEEALSAAANGIGGIVSIEGEAGIGKSRLAEEAVRRARDAGFVTSWTSCLDEIGTPILWPWDEALANLGQPATVAAQTEDTDPDAARFKRVVAVLSALTAASQTTPILLVIDDLQWADPASLQALRILATRQHRARLVVIVTVRRPDETEHPSVYDLLTDLSRQRHVHRVRLAGLAQSEVATLIDDLAGEPVELAMAQTVSDRTAGNPFFVSELVRLLVSEDALHLSGTGNVLDTVPDSVREVVERRVGRLPEDTRTLLRLASITNPVVELDVLEQATALPAERIITLLETAVMTGLLVELDDRVGWRFAHALVQDAVQATLGRAQRARLHAALADAVETVHAGDLSNHLEELAHHNVEAALLGRSGAAVRWSTEAALDARRNGRFDRAARLWSDALRALETIAADRVQRFDLLLNLAQDQRASGDTQAFGESLMAAIALARSLRDQHRIALAAAELGWVNLWNTRPYGMIDDDGAREIEALAEVETDTPLAARLFGAVAVELYYGPRRAHGEVLARKAVALARQVAEPVLLGRTLNNFVLAAWAPGADPERLAACNESLALVGHGLPAQTEVVARMHRASMHLRSGDIALVEADLARCRSLAAEVAIPEITGQLLYAECGLAIMRAQWAYAERLAEEAYEIHSRTELWGAQWCRIVEQVAIRGAQGGLAEFAETAVRLAQDESLVPARATAVLAVAQTGDLAEARRLMKQWDRRDEPLDWSWDHRISDWAEAAAIIGSPDAGELYGHLLPYADRLRVSGTAVACRGSMHGVLARLAVRLDDLDAARQHRDAAIRANRSVDAGWWADQLASELAGL